MTKRTHAMGLPTDSTLTPMETKVAAGYVAGMTGKEIASANHISYSTVVSHTQNIYEKAGIQRCTNALVSWFLEHNFALDLSELKRQAGAMLLLGLVCLQLAVTDFDNSFVRARSARATRTSRKAGRRGRREDEPTIDEL